MEKILRRSKRNASKHVETYNKPTRKRFKPVDSTPERKYSIKDKFVEYISDYRFQEGSLQFRAKWKGLPESSGEWKNRDFFRDETLQNFLKDYKKKYLLYCTDKNHEKILTRDDMGFEESFASMSLLGIPKYKYKNEEKTFKFTSDYEIEKYKPKMVLRMQKDEMNAALKPKKNFEIENEVDAKHLPKYLKWSKNYPGVEAYPKVDKNDVQFKYQIQPCKCKTKCTFKVVEGKAPFECCLNQENHYQISGRVKVVDDNKNTLYECDSSCRCDEKKCLNRVVQKGSNCSLCIFKTLDMGWGVKTMKKIKKGTYISEYCGDIIDNDECEKRQKNYENLGNKYFLNILNDNEQYSGFTIDPTICGNEARFFNQSCEPNMQIIEVNTDKMSMFTRVAFFAKRDIDEGEELTWHYGGKVAEGLECRCAVCKK